MVHIAADNLSEKRNTLFQLPAIRIQHIIQYIILERYFDVIIRKHCDSIDPLSGTHLLNRAFRLYPYAGLPPMNDPLCCLSRLMDLAFLEMSLTYMSFMIARNCVMSLAEDSTPVSAAYFNGMELQADKHIVLISVGMCYNTINSV